MNRRMLLALPLIGFASVAANEPILVPDVSQRQIDVRYSFSGAELLLFGAIAYPGGNVPDGKADIAVVLKGPPQSVLIREKQKVLGIWVNADSTRFRSVPSFYSIASSRPVKKLVDARTAAIYELGLDTIQLSPAGGEAADTRNRFERGLIELRRKSTLFAAHENAVEISQGVLYRARLAIPSQVPVGRYTAETFLIRDGRVIAAATRSIDIRKSGFEKFVADAARKSPILYGLFAVALSLALGWIASAIFRRV
jgi:uncharacterized protein (TIGR02186 family)